MSVEAWKWLPNSNSEVFQQFSAKTKIGENCKLFLCLLWTVSLRLVQALVTYVSLNLSTNEI